MTRRGGYVVLAASTVIFCLCAGLIVWRLTARRTNEQAPPPAIAANKPAESPANARLTPKISTIIDLPGDPVLVRRGIVSPPKELPIAVPAKLGLENERPADRPATAPRAYELDRVTLAKRRRGLEGAPQPHRVDRGKRLVHLDRPPVAPAVGVPERIDDVNAVRRRSAAGRLLRRALERRCHEATNCHRQKASTPSTGAIQEIVSKVYKVPSRDATESGLDAPLPYAAAPA